MREQQTLQQVHSREAESEPTQGKKANTLNDPAIWHWWFFLRGHDIEKVKKDGHTVRKDRHWQVFKNALLSAAEHTHKDTALVYPIEEDPTNKYPYPPLFAKVPHDLTQNPVMSMYAPSRLDATYIRFVWTKIGRTDAKEFIDLRQRDWSYDTKYSAFLGETICLMAEITKPAEEGEKRPLAESVCREILSGWQGKSTDTENPFEIALIEVACGFYATSAELDKAVWVLLVWEDDQSRRQATRMLDAITPSFMLAWLKTRYIKRLYEYEIRPKANDAEEKLETAAASITPEQMRRLNALEQFTLDIILPSDELYEQTTISSDHLITLKVNKENLENLLKDPVFKPGEALMDSLLVAPIRLIIDQVETDLTYKAITQTRAEKKREASKTMTEIRTNRWTRRSTIALGVFVVFGVVQAFDRELNELGKLLPLPIFVNELASWNQGWPKVVTVALGLLILWIIFKTISHKK